MDRNTTSGVGPQLALPQGIMTQNDFTIVLFPMSAIGMTTALVGTVTNSVCIHVFSKMKGKDAVSISFLGLASSDLAFCVFTLFSNAWSGLFAIERLRGPQTRVDPYMLFIYFGIASICVNEVTILITLYLALVRCLCVAMPLRFRYSNMFTPATTRGFIAGAWLFSVGINIPIYANMGVQEIFSPALNTTKYVLWFSAHRERIKEGIFLLIQTIVPFSTQVILVICIAVMVTKLIQTNKFRQKGKTSRVAASNKDSPELKPTQDDVEPGAARSSGKLSGKELQAVTQVVFISVIFVVCNIPMILVAVSGMVVPGFANPSSSGSRYGRLYVTAHGYKRLFELINSSINVFVYYKFNTKFRESCRFQATHSPRK